MGAFFETIPQSLISWIRQQKIIWVASAPLSGEGHINISPKGGPYFDVVDERTFYWADLTGSGIETTSHLYEPGNGRICVLLNAFEGPPRIMRLFGKGTVLEYGTPEFERFIEKHSVNIIKGVRSIVVVNIHQVGTSCGFSVPFYDFREHRTTLNEFAAKRYKSQEEGNFNDSMERYWAHKNSYSMDGLPGLERGRVTLAQHRIPPIKKMVGKYALSAPRTPSKGIHPAYVILGILLGFFAGALSPFWTAEIRRQASRYLL